MAPMAMKAVFELRMLCIEDLQVVRAGLEELLRLPERQTVLSLIAEVLRIVPLEVHEILEGKLLAE